MEAPNSPAVKRRRTADRLLRKPALLPVKVEDEKPGGRAGAPGTWRHVTKSRLLPVAELLHPPARDRSPSWEQRRQLLPGVARAHADAVRRWSVRQVCAFVGSLPGCQDLAHQFGDEVRRQMGGASTWLPSDRPATDSVQQIDGGAFLLLTQRDIIRIMSIKLGPALKIYNSILLLKHEDRFGQDEASARRAGKKRSRDEDQNPPANQDNRQAHDADRGGEKTRARGQNVNPSSPDTDEKRSGRGDEDEKRASDEQDKRRAGGRDTDPRDSCSAGKTKPRPNIKPEKTLPSSHS